MLLAVLIATSLVLIDLARTTTNPLNLIQPGLKGPSAEVFRRDFPGAEIPDSSGLDGQQYYAIARSPFDLDEAAEHLDRPRYRLQRPLLSWLGWLGHPTGGGRGLIASLFIVGLASVAGLAAAVGDLSRRFGGPAWTAALVGLFPGVWWSLRVTVADTLAAALSLGTIALLLSRHTRSAVLCACAAVLAKETAAVILVGWLLGDWRDGRRWLSVGTAATVALAWHAFLRLQFPDGEVVAELGAPLTGLVGAVRDRWLHGDELWGMLGTGAAVAVAALALARAGLAHPLGPAIVVQLLFLSVASADVLGNDFGAGRATLPLLALSVITAATPSAGSGRCEHGDLQSGRLGGLSHGAAGTA